MYKQIIIARKDLNMSPGKLAAQVSHASMAFLTTIIRNKAILLEQNQYMSYANPLMSEKDKLLGYRRGDLHKWASETKEPYFYADQGEGYSLHLAPRRYKYTSVLDFEPGIYEQWIDGAFTKCILEAKNRNQLLKAKTIAESLEMREGHDFFLIRDNCSKELEPEDEDGRTLTCIGFKPMDSEVIDKVGKKFQLWR